MITPSINYIAHNLAAVTIGRKHYYFSYNTIVAFEIDGSLTISENIWSKTTGKHLNYINPDHSIRIDNLEFDKLLAKL